MVPIVELRGAIPISQGFGLPLLQSYIIWNGNFLPFGKKYCPPDYTKKIEMPKNLGKMIELAETISHNTVLSRIDFYEIDGQVYFGEITFYPGSGF